MRGRLRSMEDLSRLTVVANYDPNQPRADDGKWTDGGGGGGKGAKGKGAKGEKSSGGKGKGGKSSGGKGGSGSPKELLGRQPKKKPGGGRKTKTHNVAAVKGFLARPEFTQLRSGYEALVGKKLSGFASRITDSMRPKELAALKRDIAAYQRHMEHVSKRARFYSPRSMRAVDSFAKYVKKSVKLAYKTNSEDWVSIEAYLDDPIVVMADWEESKHPRADDGKWTDGGGGSGGGGSSSTTDMEQTVRDIDRKLAKGGSSMRAPERQALEQKRAKLVDDIGRVQDIDRKLAKGGSSMRAPERQALEQKRAKLLKLSHAALPLGYLDWEENAHVRVRTTKGQS